MVKDRTFEFRSTVDSISGGNFTRTSQTNLLRNNQFLDKATGISQEFPKISAKLDQLKKLATNKSIFDDKPEEFEEHSGLIKHDLSILNRRIQELKNSPQAQQSPSQPPFTNKTILDHQKNVILILQNWTAQSFKSFENILEIRSQNLKSKKDRKDQFGSGNEINSGNFLSSFRPSTPPNKSPFSSSKTSPLKQRPIDLNSQQPPSNPFAQAPISHIDTISDNYNNVGNNYKKYDGQTHVSIDFSNQQQTLMMEQEPLLGSDSKNIRARNNALGAIESTINELGTIYQQLAHLVAEQGESIQRIDYNIEDMSTNVLSGQNHLARYLRRVSSNRFLIAKIFLVFIIFIIIFKILFL